MYKRQALHWSPVWIPAVLIWLIVDRGLEPALAERARLAEARPAVMERHERAEMEYRRARVELSAWSDETYRERRRRAGRQTLGR